MKSGKRSIALGNEDHSPFQNKYDSYTPRKKYVKEDYTHRGQYLTYNQDCFHEQDFSCADWNKVDFSCIQNNNARPQRNKFSESKSKNQMDFTFGIHCDVSGNPKQKIGKQNNYPNIFIEESYIKNNIQKRPKQEMYVYENPKQRINKQQFKLMNRQNRVKSHLRTRRDSSINRTLGEDLSLKCYSVKSKMMRYSRMKMTQTFSVCKDKVVSPLRSMREERIMSQHSLFRLVEDREEDMGADVQLIQGLSDKINGRLQSLIRHHY